VSLIELIVNPEKFNGKIITVRGFLQIQHEQREITFATLYLHEEDEKHLLDNGVLVKTTEQMIQNKEKLDLHYVVLTGKVRITPTDYGGHIVSITDIQSCIPWTNPGRALGRRRNGD
jgi:hypothetical protein